VELIGIWQDDRMFSLSQVAEQQRAAGTLVARNTTIALVVSDGPEALVPNGVGQTLVSAGIPIANAGLILGPFQRQINARPKGEVIVQQHTASTHVARGASMGLMVSNGAGVSVPDIVGMTQSAAFVTIRGVSLSAFTERTVAGQEPAGQVVGQRPGAGTRLVTGGRVGLTVSSGSGPGPGPVTVP
jgi:beta-lactam-binding protein with PASTA domain